VTHAHVKVLVDERDLAAVAVEQVELRQLLRRAHLACRRVSRRPPPARKPRPARTVQARTHKGLAAVGLLGGGAGGLVGLAGAQLVQQLHRRLLALCAPSDRPCGPAGTAPCWSSGVGAAGGVGVVAASSSVVSSHTSPQPYVRLAIEWNVVITTIACTSSVMDHASAPRARCCVCQTIRPKTRETDTREAAHGDAVLGDEPRLVGQVGVEPGQVLQLLWHELQPAQPVLLAARVQEHQLLERHQVPAAVPARSLRAARQGAGPRGPSGGGGRTMSAM
jgi:hypothetical protein